MSYSYYIGNSIPCKRRSFPLFLTHLGPQHRFSPMVNPLKMG